MQEERLKLALEGRARNIPVTTLLPFGLDLVIAFENLELSSGIEKSLLESGEEDHYASRRDFEQIVASPCGEKTNVEQIFDLSKKKVETETKCVTNNKSDCEAFVHRYGNTVVFVGKPGCGKTMLAKRLVQLVLNRQILPDTQYIFYIPCRDIDFSSDPTLFRFLMTGCEWEHSVESDKLFVDKLNGNLDVVFIFDGLDEVNIGHLFQENAVVNESTLCKPNIFLKKIFDGQIFPLAKKIFTCRSRQFFELNPDCKPQFVIDILGFNEESQAKLGKQVCLDNFQTVREFLLKHPNVSASCSIPAICIIVFGVLNMSIEENGEIKIQSLADLLLSYYIRSDYFREDSKEVWHLGNLAWKGFIRHKITFTQSDVDAAPGNVETLQLLFLNATTKSIIKSNILDGELKFTFTCLVWQEFFAAINAMYVLSVEEFKQYLCNLTEPSWESLSKFIFGLVHYTVVKKMEKIFPPGVVKGFSMKKSMLHDQVVALMRQHADAKEDFKKPNLLFQVCSWVQEAGDSALTAQVASHLPKKIVLMKSMHPTDVFCLIHVLQRSRKLHSVSAVQVNFHQDSLRRLLKGIVISEVKLDVLDLSIIPIDDDIAVALAETINNISKNLRLASCKLTTRTTVIIAKKIASLSKPMEELDLYDNFISDEAAAALAQAIHNIKMLKLESCRLTNHAMIMVANNIESLSHLMDKLDLADNSIGDDVAAPLAASICNIAKLRLQWCDLSNRTMKLILKKIASLTEPMEELNISYNFVEDDAVELLVDAIGNIKKLDLTDCYLSSRSTTMITNHITSLPHSMDELCLCGNAIDDDAATALADAMFNIKKLDVSWCDLSSLATTMIANKINFLPQPKPEVIGLKDQS